MLTLLSHLPGRESIYRCKCGKSFLARRTNIKNGHTSSCGCARSTLIAQRNTTHGMYGTPVYSVWQSMLSRCLNPRSQAYKDYGARGITVAPEWREFQRFFSDMGQPNGLTLERVQNNEGYSKDNCYWATMNAQQNNKRSNVILEFQERCMNVSQWAAELNMPRQLIYDRLKSAWSIECALTTPKRQKRT